MATDATQQESSGFVTAVGSNAFKAGRAKSWDELTTEEQIARLRHELRNLRAENASQARFIADMAAHQHGADGRVLVPYGISLGFAQGRGYDPLD